MGANIGLLILLGTLFAIPAAIAAFFWIRWQTKKERYSETATVKNDAKEHHETNYPLPSVRLSLLPIVIPLLLIAIGSLLQVLHLTEGNLLTRVFSFLGQPIVALLAGVLLSLFLLKNKTMKDVNALLGSAMEKAGPILIVTGAGGMFGLVIRETGAGAYAGDVLLQTGMGLGIPFLIASILKTAQGSSTVAIITAASLIMPMLPSLGLDSENGKILAMLAMGAGSMMISHANDSYFWVVSRFSGIDANTTLKVYSSATIVMGLVTFCCILLFSFLLL
jgi:GntP family gluconate:H+ symporter